MDLNLLYLSMFSTICRSKDEEIDLVNIDKFYQDAPEEISKPVSYLLTQKINVV